MIGEFAPLFDRGADSGPVIIESGLGFHLVEVTDRRAPTPLPAEEGRALARRALATRARKERLGALMRRIRQEVRFAEGID
ncbi:MAG: hypothetical protein HQK87_07970 [Nitrospinae bacterium]|nr:hypothetical protein [Nitrospinota bacterium]